MKINLNGWNLILYGETAEETKDLAKTLNNAANSIESKEPGKYEFIAVKYQGKFGVYSRMLQPMEGELL